MTTILTEHERRVLELVSNEPAITRAFYLTGGTALAEFYLHHRLSEDLDFFSEEEIDVQAISALFKKIQATAGITKITYEQSFNRNLFFLHISDDALKTEFTYFPFARIERGRFEGALAIDSLLDIAVNKLFTIHQKPRSRDFIDLYCILQRHPGLSLDDLKEKAQIKFDHYLDPLQLAAQFVKASELKDYPRMLIDLREEEWQRFFLAEAKKYSESQLK